MTSSNFEEIIRFAIDKERDSVNFYQDLAEKVEDPVVKDQILKMADEERKHEKLLMNLSPKQLSMVQQPAQDDLKLSNYMDDVNARPDMTYRELLIIAMKREQMAYDFYTELEFRASDDATRKVFTLLKGEELRHKRQIEKEYEKGFMSED
ncbi:MAG TPA: rubrerythrin [Firmicutes bacterium]|nr:rubrerythrin [Bacillota bacterium]